MLRFNHLICIVSQAILDTKINFVQDNSVFISYMVLEIPLWVCLYFCRTLIKLHRRSHTVSWKKSARVHLRLAKLWCQQSLLIFRNTLRRRFPPRVRQPAHLVFGVSRTSLITSITAMRVWSSYVRSYQRPCCVQRRWVPKCLCISVFISV